VLAGVIYLVYIIPIMINEKGQNTMNTLFAFTTIMAAILAVGSIEDCGGHCAGQENWLMFTIMVAIMAVSGIMTVLTTEKD